MNRLVHRYSMKNFVFSYEGVENPAPLEGKDESYPLELHEKDVSIQDISLLSLEKIALLKSGFLPKFNKSPTCLSVALDN